MTNETKARRILEALDCETEPIVFDWDNAPQLIKKIREELDWCEKKERQQELVPLNRQIEALEFALAHALGSDPNNSREALLNMQVQLKRSQAAATAQDQ